MRDSTTEELESFLADHAPLPLGNALAEGELVGEWRIAALLGKGGNGEVYRAVNVHDHSQVALKIQLPSSDRSVERENLARQRFERETQLLAENVYPFFPRFHGSGEVRGGHYIAMELLEPVALPSADAEVAAFIMDVATAVRALHLHGFVHRDLKPQNIMRRANGELVLIDLGLVKEVAHPVASQAPDVTVTMVGNRVVGAGTPRYAAPEQFTGDAISPATDIYALGLLVNECFGGHPSRAWERIINRATSTRPEWRYADVVAFTEAIRRRHRTRHVAWACVALAVVGAAALGVAAIGARMSAAARLARDRSGDLADFTEVLRQGKRVYVQAGAKEGDGTREHPFGTIGGAIAAAKAGNVIEVAAGIYAEAVKLEGKNLYLVAPEGASRTIIRPVETNSVVTIQAGAGGSLVKGFTLTGGRGAPTPSSYGFDYRGGAVFAQASARIEDCILEGNGQGKPRVSACTFGGGAFVKGTAVSFKNCLIRDNFAWACGGGMMAEDWGGVLIIRNCTIEHNDSTQFVGGYKGGIALAGHGVLRLRESIVRQNGGDQLGAFNIGNEGTVAEVEYSFVEGGADANGIEMFQLGDGNRPELSAKTQAWGASFSR